MKAYSYYRVRARTYSLSNNIVVNILNIAPVCAKLILLVHTIIF